MDFSEINIDIANAKPFLKWAGGKTQLIESIANFLPKNIETFDTYIEPFVGSGAVMFWFLKQYPNIQQAVINDINKDLINIYTLIKEAPFELIEQLTILQKEFYSLQDEESRKACFLEKRNLYNSEEQTEVALKSALFIFLNRTCFNGLYRVNSKNKFNVPFGRYTNPKILDKETILANSRILQKVKILQGDYTQVEQFMSDKTFVYFDPPYKPLSKTASFNAYSFEVFNDEQQTRLFNFCKKLDKKKINWLVSNSDPKNTDENNNFFDDLYNPYNIYRVEARRNINSKGSGRGKINEILINNYK